MKYSVLGLEKRKSSSYLKPSRAVHDADLLIAGESTSSYVLLHVLDYGDFLFENQCTVHHIRAGTSCA
jgi:hypothetical protein